MMRRAPSFLLWTALAAPLSGVATGDAAVLARGGEFQVNSTTFDAQREPVLASSGNGAFVIAWTSLQQDGSGLGVFTRVFNRVGGFSGGEILANAYTTGAQARPSIALDADGNFVVVWESAGQDGSGFGLFGRSFDMRGDPIGAEFSVNIFTTGDQLAPSVAKDAQGRFVVVWQSAGRDGSGTGIVGHRFDRFGGTLGPEFPVNEFTTGAQEAPKIAMDDAGRFVVVWSSVGEDGSGSGVFGRLFDSDGAPAGAEFAVNTTTSLGQYASSVSMDPSGGFVVAWKSAGQDGDADGVVARAFSSAGLPAGGEIQVNAFTTGSQRRPVVGADAAGGFVVAWDSPGRDGSGLGVLARRFDGAGAPASDEFLVNTFTITDQSGPSLAFDGSSSFIATWTGDSEDGSLTGAFARRFFERSPALTSHAPGARVDCASPAISRPTFAWDGDGYDAFKVYVSWDPGFAAGAVLDSGSALLKTTSWAPTARKWRRACASAVAADPGAPKLYVRVFGVDRALSKRDPSRQVFGGAVDLDVVP
ncbi:MAG: hypothetical protein HY049_10160 [Acidobacteria bacterium]|nr:hypothetical protein [Acidobacteriota bacterium]